ncbi:protein MIZU-KUSSEI 1 [Telopea speciosissima]|uniref:protein MIZU-KUSSEI 1 n=1 Tax=Telopea speciosissima TaxID=54955 RepID=UPI001CC7D578|nr:protein MIZU-KUSSEI 1 [Telopea speciosissima]
MTKIDFLRRSICPCFFSSSPATSAAAPTNTTTKKRMSVSLRDDIQEDQDKQREESTTTTETEEEEEEIVNNDHRQQLPPRPSKSMVIGTIYGHRHGRVLFCIQHDRLTSRPSLLLEFSITTNHLVKEMQCGVLRISLKCDRLDMRTYPLHSIPVWTMYCNGRKVGFAVRRRATDKDRQILKTIQSVSFGAGIIPNDPTEEEKKDGGEVMYMRASYERVLGSSDSESFHLLNPVDCSDQELSIFLIR